METPRKKKITLLVPAFNEEGCLDVFYDTLREFMDGETGHHYDFEMLIVNDGSNDGTLDVIKRLRERDERVNYISLSRNFGKEGALLAGFDYMTGDCVIAMDADLQHPVSAIPEMLKYWEEGYDDVYGKRVTRGKESWLRRWLTMRFYKLLQRTSRIDIIPNVCDFRLLDRRVVRAMSQLRETQRYTKGLYSWLGFRKKEVKFVQQDSIKDKSSYSLATLFNLALDGLTSFTTAPLRIASVLGILISLGAFLYLVFIVVKTLVFGEAIQGFPTLMCTILLLGGIQLLTIGIIGEYIGRIYNEAKGRPVYIVEEHNDKKV